MKDAAGEEVLEKKVISLFDNNGNEVRQQTSYLRPNSQGMNQVTGANPYGDAQTEEISSLLEKVNNTFDGFNRLTQAINVQGGERSTVEYTYDGDDLRTQKTVRSSADGYSEQVTNYLYDRQYVILETDKADAVSVRYVKGINYIARIDQADKLSYFLFNGHGDVVQTVDEQGTIENQYDYDVFGSPTLTIELYESTIRYSGEFYDAEVGLYYLRARYYDPYVGRFISEDTYKGRANEPLSLNRYTYVLNNPLIYWDPTGQYVATDATLNVVAQGQIIALTNQYYATTSKEEKKAITDEAERIRRLPVSSDKTVISPLAFQSSAISTVLSAAAESAKGKTGLGGMSATQWATLINSVGITAGKPSTVAITNMDSGTKTSVTTTIGRTEITTSITKSITKNGHKSSITVFTPSSNQFSYKLSEQESIVVQDIIKNSGEPTSKNAKDRPYTTTEAIFILDTMYKNQADEEKGYLLSKADLKKIDSSHYVTDSMVAVFQISFQSSKLNMSVSDANAQYNAEHDPIAAAISLITIGGTKIGVTKTSPIYVNKKGEIVQKGKICNCFTAGTKVLTDEGEKNIEDIEVGDMVLSKNEETGEQVYKEVLNLFRNQRDEIYKLSVSGQIIETTFNHPFWVEGKGWVLAEDLEEGDKLQKSNGDLLTIDNIEIVSLKEKVTVYNFEVEDFHTYFVSDLGIWVHNTNTDKCKSEGTGKFNEVEVVGPNNKLTELDEIDLNSKTIFEDKNASGLYMSNPTVPQTEQQWAKKQIYNKTVNRIDTIQNASSTRPTTNGSKSVPSVSDIQSINNYVFRINADTPALRKAVQNEIDQLKIKYPSYNFTAQFGGS
ncbi:polymorphic toxin-type HINT domain-containing protein [Paenibacillus sp. FSL H8-0537]|uniref:polymorphic toxin-type HINT domain-containing protein n=1 Tax=Paenibacillus sp. FSL H8-0537 TaxID=2921399 RepID=UPI00310189AE